MKPNDRSQQRTLRNNHLHLPLPTFLPAHKIKHPRLVISIPAPTRKLVLPAQPPSPCMQHLDLTYRKFQIFVEKPAVGVLTRLVAISSGGFGKEELHHLAKLVRHHVHVQIRAFILDSLEELQSRRTRYNGSRPFLQQTECQRNGEPPLEKPVNVKQRRKQVLQFETGRLGQTQ